MSNINEPLAHYEANLKENHSQRVAEYFEELLQKSNIDVAENSKTISTLKETEAQHSKNRGQKNWWIFLRVTLWTAAVIAGLTAFGGVEFNLLLLLVGISLAAIDLFAVGPKVKKLKEANVELDAQIKELADAAWEQMKPLNQLFTWNISKELAAKTFPDLKFDDHFSESALQDLVDTYGLDGHFNQGRSILRIQSGNLYKNPIVFYRFLQHWIGSKTYTGSMVIYWTETIRNAQGQSQTIQRSQTLYANVTKAHPEFGEGAAVILGHEAAPSLSFSRSPSNLSGISDSFFNSWRKSSALKGIEKKAKKQLKSGSGQLTAMSNREFETLFKALDRDNEIEFRLLFTPLAQQEMVKLLNDKSVGHGDDFVFAKRGRINYVEPANLAGVDLDPSPNIFFSNDLDQARQFFYSFNVEFFRSLYFSIAPLLSIPLYSDSRRLPIASKAKNGDLPNAWEVEVMANAVGEANLCHRNSITRNLLTAEIQKAAKGGVIASVTALGYEGYDRVDFVPVLGGDGFWHQVPVPWIEYIAVENRSELFVARVGTSADSTMKPGLDYEGWESTLGELNADQSTSVLRGYLGAAILD